MASLPTLPPIPDNFSDHKYAKKHGVPLWLRIYPTDVPQSSKGQPWVLWIHGGAYCSGQHYELRPWFLPTFHPHGINVVTISYRLAPYVSMEEQLEDCVDAFNWCRANLASVLPGCDVDNFVVGGDSSGGGLATLIPFRITPPPKAVFNLYGVTDLLRLQDIYDQQPPNTKQWSSDACSEDEVKRIMDDRDPSHAVTNVANSWNLTFMDEGLVKQGRDAIASGLKAWWKVSDNQWKFDRGVNLQWDVKSYIGDHSLMIISPMRITPDMPRGERDALLKAYSARHLVSGIESSKGYPPTIFLHGTGDTAVPVESSQQMAARLRSKGVEVQELYCPGANHGWDFVFTGPEADGWNDYIVPVGRFCARYLAE